ncbi:MAG: GIY-YIG nuclease family protein [Chitinophagales bacterium]|nr:GIY-YIG nuclease family protein [Chitinophagales bacterium]MBP9189643.1 GIY-YIG nuclease family protein [Chitinophagales bacterium]
MIVYVYALKNKVNNEIYVGISTDTERRLKEHNSGKNRYTKAFMPWSIFFIEPCEGFEAARKREIYFKSGAGKRKLREV